MIGPGDGHDWRTAPAAFEQAGRWTAERGHGSVFSEYYFVCSDAATAGTVAAAEGTALVVIARLLGPPSN